MTQPAPYSKRSLSYCAAILCNRFIKLYMLARLVPEAEGIERLKGVSRVDLRDRVNAVGTAFGFEKLAKWKKLFKEAVDADE